MENILDIEKVKPLLHENFNFTFMGNTIISKKAFSRLKTLSTLRFNYYPNQSKPVEISKQDGVALGCETHVDSGIFTILYQDKIGGLQVQNRKNIFLQRWSLLSFFRFSYRTQFFSCF